ncbi:DUF541 domain-containing protein [Campylobacter volucris]|uniref:DUF541 domain-containing protein n=1 Tax=Campylobacter volucris TaxID=1031542 RepID=A0A5C7DQJ8_9BACT|nr:SIMPL domain-containing protein [Campylobacter volucris]TXE88044.1 DUF541 domain-containing protein [Campylobacter volucris]
MKSFFKGLGIGLLCLVLFILGVVFNTEFLGLKNQNFSALQLTRDIKVYNEITPNIYRANLTFSSSNELSQKNSIDQEDKTLIANTFKELSARIAKENFCKGGSYSLKPNYTYNQEEKKINGYNLYSNFTCNISKEKIKDYEILSKDLENIITNNPLIILQNQALQASFDEKTLDENKEKLYELALKKAYEKNEYYSKTLSKICSIKNINFDTNQARLMSLSANYDNLVLPIADKQTQELEAKIIFECK